MKAHQRHSQTVAAACAMEDDVDKGNRNMHELATWARALMDAAEGLDGELAQQRLMGRHQIFLAARQTADRIGKCLRPLPGAIKRRCSNQIIGYWHRPRFTIPGSVLSRISSCPAFRSRYSTNMA